MNTVQKFYTLIIAFIILGIAPSIAQNANPDHQQLRLHIKKNGKIQFVDFALSKTYFSKASVVAEEDEQDAENLTGKGTNHMDYDQYAYFLSKNGTIISCSNDGDFNDETSGIYTLSAYTFPSGIAGNSFVGKSVKTIENHPMFRKDPDVYRLMVTLIVPEKEEPVVSM